MPYDEDDRYYYEQEQAREDYWHDQAVGRLITEKYDDWREWLAREADKHLGREALDRWHQSMLAAMFRCGDISSAFCDYLQTMPDSEREEVIDGLRQKLVKLEKNGDFLLTQNHIEVLKALNAANVLQAQEDICAALPNNFKISRKTLGICIKRLLAEKFIEYPEGPRKGAAITPNGREYLKDKMTSH